MQLASDVIAQHETVVGFAPEEHRGLYVMQITESGEVRYIDNKNNVSTLAVLSAPLIGKMQKAIDGIQSRELQKPDGPICMDAPSELVRVVSSTGTAMTVYRNVDCQKWCAKDPNAAEVARAVRTLEQALRSISELYLMDPDRID